LKSQCGCVQKSMQEERARKMHAEIPTHVCTTLQPCIPTISKSIKVECWCQGCNDIPGVRIFAQGCPYIMCVCMSMSLVSMPCV
jgi:hypothetical protein